MSAKYLGSAIADKNGDGKVDMGEIAQTLVENFGKKGVNVDISTLLLALFLFLIFKFEYKFPYILFQKRILR